MENIAKVIRHEIVTKLSKPSFWLMTFIFPLIVLLPSIGSQYLAQENVEAAEQNAPGQGENVLAIVDEGNILQEIPEALPRGLVSFYANRDEADAAVHSGEIAQYYILGEDFADTGEVIVVVEEFSLFQSLQESYLLNSLIRQNLLGDYELGLFIDNPIPEIETFRQSPVEPGQTEFEADENFVLPYGVMMVLYMLIVIPGGMMLSSVTQEKENRTMEVLLLSLRPRDLMLGKLLGISAIALFQTLIWGGGILVARQSARESLGEILNVLDPGLLLWGLVFLLFGFLLYASMQGALGAIMPNTKEGSQFTFILLLPMIVPLILISVFMENPNGALATFLSLFPLTSATSMMTRMVVTSVPLWQSITSLAILAVTTLLVVSFAARFFRADTLLSGTKPSRAQLMKTLRKA